MFVKICGLTGLDDARVAVDAGADALGFVLAPSPRRVEVDTVRAIVSALPPSTLTIGVFRGSAPDEVVAAVRRAGLSGAQLHGHETVDDAAIVRAAVGFVVAAFGAGDPRLADVDRYDVDAVLLDAPTPGSGAAFDWASVGDLPGRRRVILAGGLGPDTVGRAIAEVGPWGVDVSSGVESAPGAKDPDLVRRFVAAARAASPLPPPGS